MSADARIEKPIICWSNNQPAGRLVPSLVNKRWGYEEIFMNGESISTDKQEGYCMKAIHIAPGCRTSKHLHICKAESMYVSQGELTLRYTATDGTPGEKILTKGQAFCIPPGFQHQLCAGTEELILLEASTPDSPNDSIRVEL